MSGMGKRMASTQPTQPGGVTALGRIAVLLVFAFTAFAAHAGTASASSPIISFFTDASTSQAGAHPDITIESKQGTSFSQVPKDPCHCNDPKTITTDLPAGVIGNPHATPRCAATEFAAGECSPDSQVGVVAILLSNELQGPTFGTQYLIFPLYNLLPRADEAGLVGFLLPGKIPIYSQISARTGSDYGLRVNTADLEHFLPPYGINTYLWGVPADPSHDILRFAEASFIGCVTTGDPRPALREGKYPPPPCSGPLPLLASSSPPVPFLSNPTTCSGPLTSSITTLAYDNGIDHAQTGYPAITGCQRLSFNPSLSATPSTTDADAPSGLDVDLRVPQFVSPTVPSPSEIRAATVELPPGFSINPNAADGKVTCSDADARFGSEEAAQCPDFSKIGTLLLDSSALPAPIPGYIYLGEPQPGDRYRIILVADGFGTHIKIAGSISADPQTGQLISSFSDLPQSPLTRFTMHFFGSERGLLATPTACGTFPVKSTFTPWASELPAQTATQFFTIDSGPNGSPCPGPSRPFEPIFEAASAGNTAGAHTAFSVDLKRADGEQNLAGLTVTTPPGFSATLKGIPYCSEAALSKLSSLGYSGLTELASPSCPLASQIGVATVGSGAGSRPLYTSGKVYLAGPYKGAPLSLVIAIPAVSGPYDLGTVAVRVAAYVDPLTAQVRAVSDPFPQILEGIPLRTRSVQVNLNRPNFALNPTNCDPLSVEATVSGDQGAAASSGHLYQVANCARLPFTPGLGLRLSGGLNRLGHPAIHASLSSEAGEANLRRVSVTLSKGELLDNGHIGDVCTRVAFAARDCPKSSLVGNVQVVTPLLDEPLEGEIYLRSSESGLPDLALDLEGQFDIEAIGKVDSTHGRFRTTFGAIPDVPISTINVNLLGGSKGLLQNETSLCGGTKYAEVRMVGQSQVTSNSKVAIRVPCGSRRPHRSTGRGRGAK